jgi:hypothetical protein
MKVKDEKKYRVAQVGDIFILLVPSGPDLERLKKWQIDLNNHYCGQIVKLIHITGQRFSPKENHFEDVCIEHLRETFEKIEGFPIYTDRIIQFYAPYWDRFVLRWRVQERKEYREFRDRMDSILCEINCPSHFSRNRHASCTALFLDERVHTIIENNNETFPKFLFMALELQVSKLIDENHFEILATINLKKPRNLMV